MTAAERKHNRVTWHACGGGCSAGYSALPILMLGVKVPVGLVDERSEPAPLMKPVPWCWGAARPGGFANVCPCFGLQDCTDLADSGAVG